MKFTGPAMLAVLNMFLIGIVLMALGLVALYIASIHAEVIGRPLYIVRQQPESPKKSRKPRSS
jgi:dolichol-phosphate mannosyltransferase